MGKRTKRSRTKITYHGRTGKPIIHLTKKDRAYIMVRAKGGGVKRLYLDTQRALTEITKGFEQLWSQAKKFMRKAYTKRK